MYNVDTTTSLFKKKLINAFTEIAIKELEEYLDEVTSM